MNIFHHLPERNDDNLSAAELQQLLLSYLIDFFGYEDIEVTANDTGNALAADSEFSLNWGNDRFKIAIERAK